MIATQEAAKLLQEDLATLEESECQWTMRFYPDKCTKLTVTSKRKPVKAVYKLHDHIIASVSSAKCLGVTITEDLKWDTHIQNICNKAHRTIGILQRNISISAISIKPIARPLVEYASTVWYPLTHVNIGRLEMVQRQGI